MEELQAPSQTPDHVVTVFVDLVSGMVILTEFDFDIDVRLV